MIGYDAAGFAGRIAYAAYMQQNSGQATILVIEDEDSIRRAVVKAFAQTAQVIEAANAADGQARMEDGYPDVVLIDHNLPDAQGIDLAAYCRRVDPEVRLVLMTGQGSTDLAVQALQQGFDDYLDKPFALARLRQTVEVQLDAQSMGRRVAKLSGGGKSSKRLVAVSKEMRSVLQTIKRVAAVPATTVLVQGESGTGKELVAQEIHRRSSRSSGRFVAINCAALSEHLLEAELFGYVKGAFTGADSKGKAGLFEAAGGGTIFLDEVGEMPLNLQTKLLRVLQERVVRRVGGLEDEAVDVRVVAATNRDLRGEVAAGRFRADLYYRLRVVPIKVPPLRQRVDDILAISDAVLPRMLQELGRPDLQLSESARQAMVVYPWPGNIRELINALERAVILANGTVIEADDLVMDESLPAAVPQLPPQPLPSLANGNGTAQAAQPAAEPASDSGLSPQVSKQQGTGDLAHGRAAEDTQVVSVETHVGPVDQTEAGALPDGALVIPPEMRNLSDIEALVIERTLAESGGQKARAAKLLGINRTTLYAKLPKTSTDPAPAG
jgi:DNA-binding NtrC family response regulator